MASEKSGAFVFLQHFLEGMRKRGNMEQHKQFVVKGHDGRCELYAHLMGLEHIEDSVSLVIGDNFDIEPWWKRTIKQKAGSG